MGRDNGEAVKAADEYIQHVNRLVWKWQIGRTDAEVAMKTIEWHMKQYERKCNED